MALSFDRVLRLGFAVAAVAWAIALPVAAAFAAAPHAPAGEYLFAALAYSVGGFICHQQAGRSFHLWGVQLPVCARCTGIYLGAAVAAVLVAARAFPRPSKAPVNARIAMPRGEARAERAPTGDPLRQDRAIVIASCVPIALTLVFEWTTGITPSNVMRALSGLPLGASVAWAIVKFGID